LSEKYLNKEIEMKSLKKKYLGGGGGLLARGLLVKKNYDKGRLSAGIKKIHWGWGVYSV